MSNITDKPTSFKFHQNNNPELEVSYAELNNIKSDADITAKLFELGFSKKEVDELLVVKEFDGKGLGEILQYLDRNNDNVIGMDEHKLRFSYKQSNLANLGVTYGISAYDKINFFTDNPTADEIDTVLKEIGMSNDMIIRFMAMMLGHTEEQLRPMLDKANENDANYKQALQTLQAQLGGRTMQDILIALDHEDHDSVIGRPEKRKFANYGIDKMNNAY